MYTWIRLSSSADLARLATRISSEYDPQGIVTKLRAGLSGAVKGTASSATTSTRTTGVRITIFTPRRASFIVQTASDFAFSMLTVTFDAKALKLACPDGAARKITISATSCCARLAWGPRA